ncbi:hypothetical protein AMTR_s00032p00174300 [Amborella trichopoda]|uniref:Uncharacterized protein n=2 Tax=Amborella trichopoda TaxID=13333 RepID=U5CP06_AMBTC|nr:hypothetical protein AMTR_s00032p00174300 [Amborella trichopoda]
MEEHLSEGNTREKTLIANLESLKAELAEKSTLQTKLEELEEKLLLAEAQFQEQVVKLRAEAAEKESDLISKLEEHAAKLQDRDILAVQVADLHIAHTTLNEQHETLLKKDTEREAKMNEDMETRNAHITEIRSLKVLVSELEEKLKTTNLSLEEQKEIESTKEVERVGALKQVEELQQKLQQAEASLNEQGAKSGENLAVVNAEVEDLKKKLSEAAGLENKISVLESKLQLANAKLEDKGTVDIQKADVKNSLEVKYREIGLELKDTVEVKSRDIGSTVSSPSKKKSKRRAEAASTKTIEPSGMNFKFILGVAFVSIIVGIILGKRY